LVTEEGEQFEVSANEEIGCVLREYGGAVLLTAKEYGVDALDQDRYPSDPISKY
jgi:hypothetical protein